ncbi:type II toxin-antitoxin system VapC family toxin [Brevibacterium marinum]|uniref:RNase VapC n=1 Tax=Brevibacterium marinum TaxID=418643 RepID=A0A846S872_9MICO|nr:type II toxin-antitoxin system VapC family toxin [Brevibacterium marinum]NJC57017.1 hypothetical protein [Brevibacterium marinum]
MNFLLDTNTVSALRIRGRHPEVEKRSETVPLTAQFISAPTLAEIERGVTSKERQGSCQRLVLRGWLEERLLPGFAGRIHVFDVWAARVLGLFRVPEHVPLDDVLIASIAVAKGMTVATRNTRHFEPLEGVRLVNPWVSH